MPKTSYSSATADKNLLLLAAIVVIVSATIFFIIRQKSSIPTPATVPTITIHLSTQNNSYESGTATLKQEGGKVVVTLLTGTPNGVAQPAHIHLGSCPTPGAIKYPLTNVVNGKSETTLNITLAELKSQLPLAINVHKSASQAGVYVACGNILLPK